MIGLLCTSDGIPVAHHVFSGNTNDATTLATVLRDLAERFAVGRICVVADRGLMSVANVEAVTDAGFDHILATKLRRDAVAAQALAAIEDDTAWVEIAQHSCRAADICLEDGTRAVVVESDTRARRDTARTAQIVADTETKLRALEDRVRAGRLKDHTKIGAAAQRILATVGAARLFDTDIGVGRFLYHYNEDAHQYEELLAGRYVLATSLTPTQANTAQVVGYYRQLQAVEARFRVVGDFLRLRPVRHWTEQRVRGHVAVCVYAAVVETLINHALTQADVRDPDLPNQQLTAARALRDLNRIRRHQIGANGRHITLTTRRSPLQTRTLTAIGTGVTVVNGQNVTVSWPAVSTCCRSRLVLGDIWLSGSASDSCRVVGYSAALFGRLLLAAVIEVGGEGDDGFGTWFGVAGEGAEVTVAAFGLEQHCPRRRLRRGG